MTSSEYAIILNNICDAVIVDYIMKRIREQRLLCRYEKLSNEDIKCIHIQSTKQWLISQLKNTCTPSEIELFHKMPKSAIVPSSLLLHTIHSVLEEIAVDHTFIELLSKQTNNDLCKAKLIPNMDKLLCVCRQLEIIDDILPLPSTMDISQIMQHKKQLWKLFFNFGSFFGNNQLSTNSPLDKIRDYFGEELAFYFTFMDHYLKWLMIPSMVGLIFYLTRTQDFNVDHSKYMPIFSIFICIWSHCMIKFWNRRANTSAFRWQTLELDENEYDVRPEFEGELHTSPITDKPERYYPSYKRYPKFMAGFIITLFMLSIAVAIIVCSLNTQGYVHCELSILYIQRLHKLSETGAIFDADSDVMWIVPVLIHTIVIFMLNTCYSTIAYKLTEWENWKFEEDFENSLIFKRFLFEFLDAYFPLFYLCFYEMQMETLTNELFGLFLCDEIRRIFTESIIPLLILLIKNGNGTDVECNMNMILMESKLNKYELFDDYLEMLTQFGYITLFASAYPLASLLAMISNIFEICSDSFKLCFLSQRPIAQRPRNIHSTWIFILRFLAWFGILTNCFIFAFTSDQMEEWFPKLFKSADKQPHDHSFKQGFKEMKKGKARYVLLIMFALEHIIGIVCLAVHYFISDFTKEVDVQLKREKYSFQVQNEYFLQSRLEHKEMESDDYHVHNKLSVDE